MGYIACIASQLKIGGGRFKNKGLPNAIISVVRMSVSTDIDF